MREKLHSVALMLLQKQKETRHQRDSGDRKMVPQGHKNLRDGGRVGETYGKDLMILRRSFGATRLQLLANKSFTF